MKRLLAALARLWSRKLLWLEETFLAAVLAAGFYGWLALPVASALHLALHILTGLALLAVLWLALRLAARELGPFDWKQATSDPYFWLAGILCLALSFWLPYNLIWWIPGYGSFAAQAASAGIRFLAAGLMFSGGLLWWAACATRQE